MPAGCERAQARACTQVCTERLEAAEDKVGTLHASVASLSAAPPSAAAADVAMHIGTLDGRLTNLERALTSALEVRGPGRSPGRGPAR